MSHTPGKWRTGKGGPNGCPTVGTERGLLICMLGHTVNIPSQAETARANAHLISAAPDMFKEGSALVRQVFAALPHLNGQAYSSLLSQANAFKAALTKAQGLSPEREEAARPERKNTDHASTSPGPINCSIRKRFQGEAYPKTCERCRLGPCPFFHEDGSSKCDTQREEA